MDASVVSDQGPLEIPRSDEPGEIANAHQEQGASVTCRSDGRSQSVATGEYGELKRLIDEQGLLERRPAPYVRRCLVTLGLLGLSGAMLVVVDSFWLQLLNAAFFAFIFGQIGFLGHDSGHQQIFRTARKNDISGLVVNFILGLSRTWWVDKHNRHHSNPNQLLLDPDTFIPVLAFSEEQALERRGFYRLMVKYQAYLFFPLLCLQGFGVRLASVQYLLHKRAKYPILEPMLMAISVVPCVGIPIYLLGVWEAVAFLLVHQMVYGVYIASVFAPNHKGMPILESDSGMDFIHRQVLTARNVKSHPITDFWYGGLNYQIEHHLFPSMPRGNLRRARKIVKAFCEERSIAYYETSALQSYREILRDLHRVSAPLRTKRPRITATPASQ